MAIIFDPILGKLRTQDRYVPSPIIAETDFLFSNGSDFLFSDGSDFLFKEGINTEESFETVSKNLDASDSTFNYTGDNLTSIVYANGITKTFNYTGDNLTSVVLSGSTPGGIDLTKTLSYTGDNLTGVAYS